MRFVLHALDVYLSVVTPMAQKWAKIEYKDDSDFAPAFCLLLGGGLALAALLLLAVLFLVFFAAFRWERQSNAKR